MAKRRWPNPLTSDEKSLLFWALKPTGWSRVSVQHDRLVVSKDSGRTTYHWNPLYDPGDAMELAVLLGMTQEHRYRWSIVREGRLVSSSCCVPQGDLSPLQAACRAIVVCAAETAKRQEPNPTMNTDEKERA